MSECIFCNIAKKKEEFILESENFFAVSDIKPVSKGHSLIIPKKHVDNIFELDSNLGNELLEFIKKLKEKLNKEHSPNGYNMNVNTGKVAGQIVFHLHIHLIPRYKNE